MLWLTYSNDALYVQGTITEEEQLNSLENRISCCEDGWEEEKR